MYKENLLLFMYAETPVHWGAGSSFGVVDLPIQRERHTGYPMAQATGIKGSIRDWFESNKPTEGDKIKKVFGPLDHASEHAGCVAFSDARLLLFPVRSLKGVWAYCTSRHALSRLKRELEQIGINDFPGPPVLSSYEKAFVASQSIVFKGKIVLEDCAFESASKPNEENSVSKIAHWLVEKKVIIEKKFWEDKINNSLVVLHDDAFRDFVQMSTIVQAHNRIDDTTGTVDDKALFYSESLPPESLLYSLVLISDPFGEKLQDFSSAAEVLKFLKDFDGKRCQMGGDSTTGKGIIATKFIFSNGGAKV